MKGTGMGQEELFGASKINELRRDVKELDGEITKALKKKDYAKAKSLTDRQSQMLKELLDLGEAPKK
jgi:uncharacterized membrane protein (DUF106 family)